MMQSLKVKHMWVLIGDFDSKWFSQAHEEVGDWTGDKTGDEVKFRANNGTEEETAF